MKNIISIVFALMMACPSPLSAKKVYCELMLRANRAFFASSNYALVIGGKDYGYIGNADGTNKEFMNAMDAVNFMASKGWRVVTVHSVSGVIMGKVGSATSVDYESYLMEREIDDSASVFDKMIIIPYTKKNRKPYKRSDEDGVY